ncbi:hypothetical protein TNCV_3737241 [Trichonephila clavipes]|nr:hypothetical protein TNCV_3737241 [Trichonephila clavipes]
MLVSRSFEHRFGENTMQIGSTLILRENNPGRRMGSLPPFFAYPPTLREDSGTKNIYSAPCRKKGHSFTKIHALSGVRIHALRYSSQRH